MITGSSGHGGLWSSWCPSMASLSSLESAWSCWGEDKGRSAAEMPGMLMSWHIRSSLQAAWSTSQVLLHSDRGVVQPDGARSAGPFWVGVPGVARSVGSALVSKSLSAAICLSVMSGLAGFDAHGALPVGWLSLGRHSADLAVAAKSCRSCLTMSAVGCKANVSPAFWRSLRGACIQSDQEPSGNADQWYTDQSVNITAVSRRGAPTHAMMSPPW